MNSRKILSAARNLHIFWLLLIALFICLFVQGEVFAQIHIESGLESEQGRLELYGLPIPVELSGSADSELIKLEFSVNHTTEKFAEIVQRGGVKELILNRLFVSDIYFDQVWFNKILETGEFSAFFDNLIREGRRSIVTVIVGRALNHPRLPDIVSRITDVRGYGDLLQKLKLVRLVFIKDELRSIVEEGKFKDYGRFFDDPFFQSIQEVKSEILPTDSDNNRLDATYNAVKNHRVLDPLFRELFLPRLEKLDPSYIEKLPTNRSIDGMEELVVSYAKILKSDDLFSAKRYRIIRALCEHYPYFESLIDVREVEFIGDTLKGGNLDEAADKLVALHKSGRQIPGLVDVTYKLLAHGIERDIAVLNDQLLRDQLSIKQKVLLVVKDLKYNFPVLQVIGIVLVASLILGLLYIFISKIAVRKEKEIRSARPNRVKSFVKRQNSRESEEIFNKKFTLQENLRLMGLQEGVSFDEARDRFRMLIKAVHPDSAYSRGRVNTNDERQLLIQQTVMKLGSDHTERLVNLKAAYKNVQDLMNDPQLQSLV